MRVATVANAATIATDTAPAAAATAAAATAAAATAVATAAQVAVGFASLVAVADVRSSAHNAGAARTNDAVKRTRAATAYTR